MRLIDADALIEEYDRVHVGPPGGARKLMEDAPTIESERKSGKWIKKMLVTETEKYISYDPEWYCACCGAKYDSHIAKIVNFCYVCGADMRGEKDAD